MIVLVGPDRCGKTSVAAAIQQIAPDWYYYHHTKPPMDPFLYFARYFMTANTWAVVDRCHWCEVAYGNTYRDGSAMTGHEFRILEMALLAHRALVVYLHDDIDAIRSRWSDDEMFKFNPDHQAKLMSEYLVLHHDSPVKSVMHKMTDLVDVKGRPTEILSKIVQLSRNDSLLSPVHRFNRPPSLGIGSTRGGVLIIGEAPGNPWSGHVSVPLAFGYSGGFLWSGLDKVGCEWEDIHIVNASTFTPESFLEFNETYGFDRIIALGKQAAKLARTLECDFYELEHPHYAKRFLGTPKQDDWVKKLGEALNG